jgi:acyl carrier protein
LVGSELNIHLRLLFFLVTLNIAVTPMEFNDQSRTLLLQALSALSTPPDDLVGLEARLRTDEGSVLLAELRLDSLGAMEFCIHLELESGVIVTPEELILCGSAEQLLSLVRLRMKRDASGAEEVR